MRASDPASISHPKFLVGLKIDLFLYSFSFNPFAGLFAIFLSLRKYFTFLVTFPSPKKNTKLNVMSFDFEISYFFLSFLFYFTLFYCFFILFRLLPFQNTEN